MLDEMRTKVSMRTGRAGGRLTGPASAGRRACLVGWCARAGRALHRVVSEVLDRK